MSFFSAGEITSPALVFLHGFLGCKEDWEEWVSILSRDYFCLALDLPGHGSTPWVSDPWEKISSCITSFKLNRPTLIGYSMGGRIALQLVRKMRCEGSVIISAHPGLLREEERELRAQDEKRWIELLERGSMTTFLEQWYAQPFFKGLTQNRPLFEKIWERRLRSDPHILAQVMYTLALSRQPFLPPPYPNTLFLYGADDLKYASLYDGLPNYPIEKAGHAAHLENPKRCIEVTKHWLEKNHACNRERS